MTATALLLGACIVITLPVYAANPATLPGHPDGYAIGLIGKTPIGKDAVIASDVVAFNVLQNDYERDLHRLQAKFAQARHDLLQQKLDKLLDERALELEAKSRAVAPSVVLAELKVNVVTDEEAHAFYDANMSRIGKPYEVVAVQIHEYLGKQRSDAAIRTFYDGLRAKHDIHSLLEPYRVQVADIGPALGPSSASVTIVEFADFQCPYCRVAETTLHALLSQYPKDIRLVFRNLPLTQLHPNALIAAKAGVCAAQQGKFWEMHDAMYADQQSLAEDRLKVTAGRLGLDTARFSACLSAEATSTSLDADAKAAVDLGLTGTPYFFVNGRPLDGNVPMEQFQSLMGEELQAASVRNGKADKITASLSN